MDKIIPKAENDLRHEVSVLAKELNELRKKCTAQMEAALTVISIVLGITGVIVLCTTMQETIIGFTNPEYGALKEIVSFIK